MSSAHDGTPQRHCTRLLSHSALLHSRQHLQRRQQHIRVVLAAHERDEAAQLHR